MVKQELKEAVKTRNGTRRKKEEASICRRTLLRNDETSFEKRSLKKAKKAESCSKCGLGVFIYQTMSGFVYRKCFYCGHREIQTTA